MKKKINSMLFFVVLFGCEEATPLHQREGQQCGLLSNGFIITGEDAKLISCNLGKTKNVMKKDKLEQICVGFRPISEEVCDIGNEDEDCDGEANNIVFEYGTYNNDCDETEIGVCRYSSKECVQGSMVCVPPTDLYGNEKCDISRYDENCNGLINEEDPELVLANEEWYYPGPEETLNVGECRAGHNECSNGGESYFGLRTPVDEICGNGDDDDCNGLIDDGVSEPTDYLLSIDYSGSMSVARGAVAEAICDWAQQDRHTNDRFAVVLFGAGAPNTFLPHSMTVVTDLVSASEACDVFMAYLMSPVSGGADEYQMDSVLYTFDEDPFLNLNWSTNKKKVVIFTDEPIHTQFGTGNNLVPQDIATAASLLANDCLQKDYSVSAFIEYYESDYNFWLTTTMVCGGFVEQLSIIPQVMVSRLNYWFGSCE